MTDREEDRLIGAEVTDVHRADVSGEEDITLIVVEKDGETYEIKSWEAMVDKKRL